jgi:hypothetical protein
MKIADDLKRLTVPIEDLREDPDNVRVHDERSVSALAMALQEFGQQKPIVALEDGTVIAGNGVFMAAKRIGAKKIAVVRFADPAKARAFAIADNRMSELSRFDEEALSRAVNDLQLAGYGTDALGFDAEEVSRLIASVITVPELHDEEPGPKKESLMPTAGGVPLSSGIEPTSHVRMVQLFLNADTEPVFMSRMRALGKVYETGNITDTVWKAVDGACEKHGVGSENDGKG